MGSQQLPEGVVTPCLSVVSVEGAGGVASCHPQW